MFGKFDPLRLGFLALLLALVPLSGCGDDDDGPTGPGGGGGGGGITVPAAWTGTWQITGTATTRGGEVSVGIVNLCAGVSAIDVFINPDELEEFGVTNLQRSCSGTWNDSVINVTCTGTATISDEELGTCTATVTNSVNATRTGNTFAGTSSFSIVVEGEECNFPFSEMETENITAELLNDGGTICNASALDVIPQSWGGQWTVSEIEQGEFDRAGGGESIVMCPGEDANNTFFGGELGEGDALEAGFTDTAAQIVGSTYVESSPCNQEITTIFDLTRTGDSITGTRTQIRVYNQGQGGTCELDGQVEVTVYDVMATRTSTDTSACK